MSWFFASNGQSIGCLASASVLPMNYSGLISFAVDWFDHLAFQGTFRVFSPGPQFENISSSALSLLYDPAVTSVHDSWKNHSLTIWTFVGKVMSLLFNMLSRFALAFLPRSKLLLISWLQSPSAVILEPKKIKSDIFSTTICHKVMGLDAMILVF